MIHTEEEMEGKFEEAPEKPGGMQIKQPQLDKFGYSEHSLMSSNIKSKLNKTVKSKLKRKSKKKLLNEDELSSQY